MAETGMESESSQPSAPPMENGITTNHVNGSSSSSNDHKSKHSSSSDKDRSDKHRSSDKHSSSSSKHHSSSSSSKSEHRSSSSSSKHHSSSSSSKDKHRDDKDRKDRDKDRSKDSDRSKDRHRDDKDRHRSDKDKDRHRDGDRDKQKSSSSSRDKHSSSSSSRDKHSSSSSSRHRDDKHSSSSSGDKKPETKMTVKTETQEIKQEENDYKLTARLDSPKMDTSVRVKDEVRSPVKGSPRVKSDSEDDVPLNARKAQQDVVKPLKKRPVQSEDSDDEPLDVKYASKKVKRAESSDDEPLSERKKVKPVVKAKKRPSEGGAGDSKAKKAKTEPSTPSKKGKKGEEEQTVWKWWEEEKRDDGVKWRFLEHKGPMFAPPYEPLPDDVHFYYKGKAIKLSEDAEEVAGFYAKMLEHDYTTKDVFNSNFFKDWRKNMTAKERDVITDLKHCNFKEIHAYYAKLSEEKKALPKEEKKKIKEQNEEITKEYGFCTMDGHKEKIGNFRIEPPGLFRGRGEHPKQGKLKTRVRPEDVIINCSRDSAIPKPPAGHKWKEVRHDNTVTWLCSWTENVQGQVKYIMLNASSRLKGEKDWQKYETARRLKKIVARIRANYQDDLKSKEMRVRQRAVAMYFIDKLALRAGNEKDEEQADTVGCCSLRVEHLNLHEQKDGKEYVVEFDFLGKDSIRYYNLVPVDKRVFKNLRLFMNGKNGNDDLFDRLNTTILNQHLSSLMDGLTAKVFRTYNASKTLQDQLDLLTMDEDAAPAKLLSYNRANRAVAVLCNHQRAVPKNFSKQMENLQNKIDAKNDAIADCRREVKSAKSDYKNCHNEKNKNAYERKKKQLERLQEQLTKLEVQQTDKDENKEIALGTSKLNYLDPRISVAWCKKHEVPIEKIYNKTQRDKFRWAIDMAGPDFVF